MSNSIKRFIDTKVIFAVSFFVIAAWLATARFFDFYSGQLESDTQMQNRFEHCLLSFMQLSTTLEDAHYAGRICCDHQESYRPLPTIKLNECQNNLKEIGTNMCVLIGYNNGTLSIDIPMWSQGMMSGGPSKGYLYSRKATQPLLPSLDNLAYSGFFKTKFCNTEGIWLKPLKNNWYIYYHFEK